MKQTKQELIRNLEAQAEMCIRQGCSYDLQENPRQAEQQYLQALRILQELINRTGNRIYGEKAGEICLSLADLSMQQGNMHGADRYYVQAMEFGAQI